VKTVLVDPESPLNHIRLLSGHGNKYAMFFYLLILLLGFAPGDPPPIAMTSHVDLIEVNHYFDNDGKPVFNQLIFYNWDESAGRFNVNAWRLLKNTNQIPIRNAVSGKFSSTWYDGKVLRTINADDRIETWTQYDPETFERAFLPKSERPDLVRPVNQD
jgi:hypothetical protein